jgi:chromosome segregation ATPase
MAERKTQTDDDLLEYARRMEKHFEAFQYLKEVLQAARDAKTNIPKYKAEAEAAEQAKNEAVESSSLAIIESEGKAKAAQVDYDAKVKVLDGALEKRQSLHDERMAKLKSDADVAQRNFELQKAKYPAELEKAKAQFEAEKAEFEKQKSAMTRELAELKASVNEINQIVNRQREAVLALRPTA